jgi:hypothetical protein
VNFLLSLKIAVHLAAAAEEEKKKLLSGNVPSEAAVKEVSVTAELFDTEIIPALRLFLATQSFQGYEVEEWVRRVQLVVAKGELDEGLRIVRDEALNGAPMPSTLKKFYRTGFDGGEAHAGKKKSFSS